MNGPLSVDQTAEDGGIRLELVGELDLQSEASVVRTVETMLAEPAHPARIVIDLCKIMFMDSSGLRALLRCRSLTDTEGVKLVLKVAEGPVQRLLKLAGVDEWFDYE